MKKTDFVGTCCVLHFWAKSSQVNISSSIDAEVPAPTTGTRLKMASSVDLKPRFVSASSLKALLKVCDNDSKGRWSLVGK